MNKREDKTDCVQTEKIDSVKVNTEQLEEGIKYNIMGMRQLSEEVRGEACHVIEPGMTYRSLS